MAPSPIAPPTVVTPRHNVFMTEEDRRWRRDIKTECGNTPPAYAGADEALTTLTMIMRILPGSASYIRPRPISILNNIRSCNQSTIRGIFNYYGEPFVSQRLPLYLTDHETFTSVPLRGGQYRETDIVDCLYTDNGLIMAHISSPNEDLGPDIIIYGIDQVNKKNILVFDPSHNRRGRNIVDLQITNVMPRIIRTWRII